MIEKKNIYLLAGGNWRSANSIKPVITHILTQTGKEKSVVAYVGTANDDDYGFFKFMDVMIRKAGAHKVKRIMLAKEKADLKKAESELSECDAVFISGGDVERGMFWLEKHNMTEFLKKLYDKGVLFFGLSAGSIMLGTQWVRWTDPKDDSSAELFDCIGIAPVLCDTHAEKDEWEELETAVLLMGSKGKGYGIPTGGVLYVKSDGEILALEKPLVCYMNNKNSIVKEDIAAVSLQVLK